MTRTMYILSALGLGGLLLVGLGMGWEVACKGGLVILLFLGVLCASRRAPERAGNRFSAVHTQPAVSDIRFSDVAANEEALRGLRTLVDYLRDPEKYIRMGARLPRGVLLYGPPGTGKTLLARALAGEAGVPFYSMAGSDFVQMYVGVGASRVRDLFAKARKAGKCVLFIDEIDAMGKKRDDSGSDEREQTLNALLSEMSGFRGDEGIIVLAATNRLDTLDPALLRPGRFDRQIEVGLPGRSERLDILRLHSRNKPLADSVDLSQLAGDTVRFSGASLESLLNEAAIRAADRGASAIDKTDIDAAFRTVVAGEDKPAAAGTKEEMALVALHEAGHALVSRLLLPENRLARVSILPSSKGAAGYNLSIPAERTMIGKRQLTAQIDVLLAGRAAEILIAGEEEITAGAADDLSRAAELACAMALDLGMTGEPGVCLRTLSRMCAGGADGLEQSRTLLRERFHSVTQLLTEHAASLSLLTETLLMRESMTGEEVDSLLAQ